MRKETIVDEDPGLDFKHVDPSTSLVESGLPVSPLSTIFPSP